MATKEEAQSALYAAAVAAAEASKQMGSPENRSKTLIAAAVAYRAAAGGAQVGGFSVDR